MNFESDFLYQFSTDNGENSKLYSFLATNYDISSLAYKISAKKAMQINVLNLKRVGSASA